MIFFCSSILILFPLTASGKALLPEFDCELHADLFRRPLKDNFNVTLSFNRRVALMSNICLGHSSGVDPRATFVRHIDNFAGHASSRAAIYFLHVSKSGGTSFCAAAYENKCRDLSQSDAFDKDRNCMSWGAGDGPRWVDVPLLQHRKGWWWEFDGNVPHRPGNEGSCQSIERRAQLSRATFFMNENSLPSIPTQPSNICQRFLNVILFRHPINRVLSHMAMLNVFSGGETPTDITAFALYAPLISRNYYVRCICGNFLTMENEIIEAYLTPELTQGHLRQAEETLQKFDIVLDLELLEKHKDLSARLLRNGLGWMRSPVLPRERHSGGAKRLLGKQSSQDLEWLSAANVLDLELYSKARELALLDLIFFESKYWDDKPQVSPTECGAYLRASLGSRGSRLDIAVK